ncbi:acyl-protein thioesterase 1 [Collybia nuda]|uniref:Acyl-protein thioesterase 1 n=1 Tax=Collybia nuda TaxID=64659 RepID=A0A9P5XY43_9AGAR|nr:acyl-protein thioesterase 1 [Collybia nuda]
MVVRKLMPVTGNRGAIMPSWFDCYSFDIPNRSEDEEGLYKAVALINDIITREERSGVPSHRIIVGGLSQGSAVSMLLGLTTQRPLAGVFILSGYIPLRRKVKEIASPLAPSLPIFWGHGRVDQQIEYHFSVKAAETLANDLDIPFNGSLERLTPEELSSQSTTPTPGLRFLTYPWLGHSVNDLEMRELAVWFSKYLPASGD